MCGGGGGTGGNIGILSNTGPDPLKNLKATKTAFNVGPSLARQRNTIKIAFRWQADDGLLSVLFGSLSPLIKKNKKTCMDPGQDRQNVGPNLGPNHLTL